ncbi:MAG: zinc ribbon domain-containing protein [Eubacteriaceae bacterium]|nr:zinc ribbon domain-containing protein [Eubacteriaceae bacterium]
MRKKDTGYVCPVCSSPVSPENRYCPVCGSLLNWQQNYQSSQSAPPRGAGRGTSKGLRIALIVLCVIMVCGLGVYYAYDQGWLPYGSSSSTHHTSGTSGTSNPPRDAKEETYQKALALMAEGKYTDAHELLFEIRGYKDVEDLLKSNFFMVLKEIISENLISDEYCYYEYLFDEQERTITVWIDMYDSFANVIPLDKPEDWDELGENMAELGAACIEMAELSGFTGDEAIHILVEFRNYETKKVYLRVRDDRVTYSLFAN